MKPVSINKPSRVLAICWESIKLTSQQVKVVYAMFTLPNSVESMLTYPEEC